MVLLYHKATHFVDLNPLSYRETNTIQYHPIPEKKYIYDTFTTFAQRLTTTQSLFLPDAQN